MKETRFIAQNKEKWREAETLLESEQKDPEKLSNLFTQVVDDLSFSRTYYPNRSVRVYLNKIARQYFSIIYGHKKAKHNQFKSFWLDELPQIIVHSRRQLFISFLVFMLAVSIGVFSSMNDPQFTSTILGNQYVSMTNENIKNGDPMAVYKQRNQVDMFLGITLNNLMVAFRTYVLGIFLGIGTLASLLQNGIMVGSFQYYFAERDLFLESSLSIWLHGTLEISSIVLAGGAGLTLASGLVFPGTYSRMESLQLSGIRSLKLMLGITPIFVLAAVIESFLTRYTGAPIVLKIALIALSAVFIVGYFVIYPWRKSRAGFDTPLKSVRLQATSNEPVNYKIIKNNAEILKDTFRFYFRHSNSILSMAFFIAIGLSIVAAVLDQQVFITYESEWWQDLASDMLYALRTPGVLFILTNAVSTSIVMYRIMKLVDADARKIPFKINLQPLLQIFVVCLLMYSAIYIGSFAIFLLFVFFGLLIFIAFVQLTNESNLPYGISQGWSLFVLKSEGISLQVFVALLSFSFLLVLSAPLLYLHLTILKWNFVTSDARSATMMAFLESFIKIFSFYLVLPILIASLSFLYFSQEEANDASNLKEAISKMGVRATKRS